MDSNHRKAVIVTGSNGLIGSAVVRRLAGTYRIIGLDLEPPAEDLPPGAEHLVMDLTSMESLAGVMARLKGMEIEIASLIHLAAFYDFSGEPNDLYEAVTIRGTEHLLREIQDRKLAVEQFIFSSTMLVHRPAEPGRPIDEESPIEAKWPYPQSKAATESLLRVARGAIPLVLLRIAGVYTDRCDSIPLSHQIQRIREDRMTAHVFPGDTSHGQAFVHLDDLVEAIRLAVVRRGELPGETALLIGEPETYSYETLQRKIARLVHDVPEWGTRQIPRAVAKTGAWVLEKMPGAEEPFIKPWMVDLADDHYELDTSRAREILGWEPRRRLITTLPRMIEDLRKDPEDWHQRHGLAPPREPAER